MGRAFGPRHCGLLSISPSSPATARGPRGSEPLPSGIARMQVVPELDVLLLLFPAKKNFLPAQDRREINQAAVEVLDLDSALLKFAQGFLDLRESFGPLVDRFPTQVLAAGKQTR